MQEINQEEFPFITGLEYGTKHGSTKYYYGVVVNYDSTILTMYDLDKMPSAEIRAEFIKLSETWWWESNRQIPIDVFLFQELIPFRYAIRTFENKHIEVKFGPVTEINNLVKKRIKRRTITLVKNVPPKDSQ